MGKGMAKADKLIYRSIKGRSDDIVNTIMDSIRMDSRKDMDTWWIEMQIYIKVVSDKVLGMGMGNL